MPTTRRLLFGTDEAVEPPTALRAGPLHLLLQRGKLLHIRHGAREIWHGVAFVYRDPDWGTPEPVVEQVDLDANADRFSVRIEAHFPVSPVIRLHLEIEGARDGRIRYTAVAVPTGDILCNRIGLCLMHPMSAAGARVEITHIDGRLSASTFPTLIPPWPPFMLVRAVRHEWADDRWARCELSGDLYETEDQRNNADASFKTYTRSNLMPRPYRLHAGVPIRHAAELVVEAALPECAASRAERVSVRVGACAGVLPAVGIEIGARDGQTPGRDTLAALRALRPAHLHLSLDDPGAVDWTGVGQLLAAARARLRLDLTVADAERSRAALHALSEALSRAQLSPESIAVFPSDAPSIDAARRAFPASAIGGGTPHFFVQLNRLEELGEVDFVSFTTSSIVHGADDGEVMLGLQSLPAMIETLRARWPTLPVRVGPSTIAARRSPLGNQPPSDGTRRIALASQDPRCRGQFGAAWTLGYAARFAAAGAQSLTLLSLSGACGSMTRTQAGRWLRHPAWFVLARLGSAARLCRASVDDPDRIAALALLRDGRSELLLANLTGEPVDVEVAGCAASASVCLLDAPSGRPGWRADRTAAPAVGFRLPPYAVASVA